MIQPQYSTLSVEITKIIPKKVKQDNGIYITPRVIIDKLIRRVLLFQKEKRLPKFAAILEPSCGTNEFINYLNDTLVNVNITGIELNQLLYNEIKAIDYTNKTKNKNTVNLLCEDFIQYSTSDQYDFIIGNPPYVVCKKSDIPKEYVEHMSGRPNLFGIFILHSLSLLKPGGILAFVVPKSFLNSVYYAKIRNFIKNTCTIVDIVDFELNDEFLETQQATMGLILHKQQTTGPTNNPCNYSLKMGDNYMFSVNVAHLQTILKGSKTLEQLGLSVKTGSIVWNEHKDMLTDDANATALLYNTNITKNNEIVLTTFKNDEKHQYIHMTGTDAPVIVVNRGNGNSAYKLNYALVNRPGNPYLAENHLNVIYSKTITDTATLLPLFNKVIDSFKDKRTAEFIKTFLGNNGLSKTELETIFPIYV